MGPRPRRGPIVKSIVWSYSLRTAGQALVIRARHDPPRQIELPSRPTLPQRAQPVPMHAAQPIDFTVIGANSSTSKSASGIAAPNLDICRAHEREHPVSRGRDCSRPVEQVV